MFIVYIISREATIPHPVRGDQSDTCPHINLFYGEQCSKTANFICGDLAEQLPV